MAYIQRTLHVKDYTCEYFCRMMERRIGSRGGGVAAAALVVLVVLANGVDAQIYTCWGGCYNVCFLRSNKSGPERLGCYYQCLTSCVPHSPADYRYYCQIGCSLGKCSALSYADGARLEKCFGRCTNICKL